MNVWVKSTIVLLLTLLIGFGLGWYSGGVYHKHKRDSHFAEMRNRRPRGGRFSMPNRIGELVQPTDAQKDTLEAIIKKYHEKFIAKSFGDFEFVRTNIDSMILELKPVLNEEQLQRLEDRRHFLGPGRGPDGPPSDDEFGKGPFGPPPDGDLPPFPKDSPKKDDLPKMNDNTRPIRFNE